MKQKRVSFALSPLKSGQQARLTRALGILVTTYELGSLEQVT